MWVFGVFVDLVMHCMFLFSLCFRPGFVIDFHLCMMCKVYYSAFGGKI